MKAFIENVIREEVRTVVKEYFGAFLELEKGPVFQVHASMTRNGLTKAVRKTKRSQLADMEVGKEYFFAAPKGVSVAKFTDRWASSIHQMKRKTNFDWSAHRDRENGGAVIIRNR